MPHPFQYNTSENRYGTVAMAALNQAREFKLKVHSGVADPDFYYGEAIELDLRELRTNISFYNGKKVAFEGIIYRVASQTAYVESYDEETGIYFGIPVYYGYNASGYMLNILKTGNHVRIVGTVSEFQGTYQVSGLQYRSMKPNDPDNIQKLGSGFEGSYAKVDAADFTKNIKLIDEDGNEKNHSFASLAVGSSISMDNLQVISIYTTNNEESSSKGAMTLTCKSGNTTITVRTEVLKFSQGGLVTNKTFEGKNINVKGLVDYYNGSYQIRTFTMKDFTFNDFEISEPSITIESVETAMIDETINPNIAVDGNAEYSVVVTLIRPNKTGLTLQKDKDYSFSASEAGTYKILVSVEDVFGKITTEERIFTIQAPEPERSNGVVVIASIVGGVAILSGALYVFVLRKKKNK